MSGFDLDIAGFDEILRIAKIPEKVNTSAARAINRAAERVRTQASRDIRDDVNLTAGYINGKLTVASRANASSLEATVRGTDRPMSLARFSNDTPELARRSKKVRLQVKSGRSSEIKGAWLAKLKNGNVGLAVRSKPGSKPSGAYKPARLRADTWLLYGPSIDQLFLRLLEPKNSRRSLLESAANVLAAEFSRQMDL